MFKAHARMRAKVFPILYIVPSMMIYYRYTGEQETTIVPTTVQVKESTQEPTTSPLINMAAVADFDQTNKQGIEAVGLEGYRLQDGSFIFSWVDGKYRKMVLTDNSGVIVKTGFVAVAVKTWKEFSVWKSSDIYSISNFMGFKQGWCFVKREHLITAVRI